MVEGEATQEPSAPEGAPASPLEENPVETHETATPAEAEAAPSESPELEASAETAAPEEPAVMRLDWSHLLGFQTVEPPGEAATHEDYAGELVKELSARATRFANAVDESIVLSSDGVMRWFGDPVARVVAGERLLTPRPVLLADEALAGEERAKVETRASLWLAAHTRKLLGPLMSLAEGTELPEAARGLGAKIAEALGVLERERVRVEARALDQNARGAMRKLGVRFGSHYIYVPILLKPAARGLCSLLWTLRRGAETGADRLLAFAAAGRTSFANEGLLSPDSYRVAGFRLCGERVVRVDIIERLSDLIRAALPDHMRAGSRPASDAYGFIVSPQMTSLTGCSGEAFASILRSLGFESVKVGRAAYEAANRRAPTEPIKPAAEGAQAPLEAAPAMDEAQPAAEAEAESNSATEAAEPLASAENTLAETAALDGRPEEAQAGEDTIAAEESAAEPLAVIAAGEESDGVATVSNDEATASAEPASVDAAPTDGETHADASLGEPADSAAADAAGEAAVTAPPEADAPAAEASAPAAGVDEEIEIWRPAPRRPRAPQRPQGAAHRDAPAHAGKPRDQRRRGRFEPAEAAAAPAAEAPPPPPPPQNDRGQGRREEEQRRRDNRGKDEAKPRDDRRPQRDFGPRRDARPVDPDSPFAKLAALKPLLERRDKRP